MIPDGDWSTLGGYAFAKIGRIPRLGDRAAFPGGELEVVAMDGRRVDRVEIRPPAPAAEEDPEPAREVRS